MGDTVRSKPWLGLLGNISASMATAAAFGFAMYLRVEFIGINLAAPFLMIGELLLLLKKETFAINFHFTHCTLRLDSHFSCFTAEE